MFFTNNITKSITVFFDDGVVDSINYKPKIQNKVINKSFIDYKKGKNQKDGMNTNDTKVFICLEIFDNWEKIIKKNNKIVIGEYEGNIDTYKKVEEKFGEENIFTIVKVDVKEYGYHPHIEVYGK